jgi:DNA-binding response OmpR family regulator
VRDVQRAGRDGLVLVVHGDEAVRATIAAVLALDGYRAVAVDHHEALKGTRARREKPAAVLLDTYGPARECAEAFRCAHGLVPIVALSTRPAAEGDSTLGAADVLPLPFDVDNLLACVARVVGKTERGEGRGRQGRSARNRTGAG